MIVYTVGHSVRSGDEFRSLLRAHAIDVLVDVRTIPGSRRHPQFGQDRLASALAEDEIDYVHLRALGGLRKPRPESTNLGWRNLSFRAYADHMTTEDFELGLEQLIALGSQHRVAIMCAEAVPWRCHRQLTADALVARGIEVQHITSARQATVHKLTPFAVVERGRVSYPRQPLLGDDFLSG